MDGWETCPIIHSGFLRISMNATVVGQAATSAGALALLEQYTSDTAHTFRKSEAPKPEWRKQGVQSYRQVTDATLFAAALVHSGVLVTLDSGVLRSYRRLIILVCGFSCRRRSQHNPCTRSVWTSKPPRPLNTLRSCSTYVSR